MTGRSGRPRGRPRGSGRGRGGRGRGCQTEVIAPSCPSRSAYGKRRTRGDARSVTSAYGFCPSGHRTLPEDSFSSYLPGMALQSAGIPYPLHDAFSSKKTHATAMSPAKSGRKAPGKVSSGTQVSWLRSQQNGRSHSLYPEEMMGSSTHLSNPRQSAYKDQSANYALPADLPGRSCAEKTSLKSSKKLPFDETEQLYISGKNRLRYSDQDTVFPGCAQNDNRHSFGQYQGRQTSLHVLLPGVDHEGGYCSDLIDSSKSHGNCKQQKNEFDTRQRLGKDKFSTASKLHKNTFQSDEQFEKDFTSEVQYLGSTYRSSSADSNISSDSSDRNGGLRKASGLINNPTSYRKQLFAQNVMSHNDGVSRCGSLQLKESNGDQIHVSDKQYLPYYSSSLSVPFQKRSSLANKEYMCGLPANIMNCSNPEVNLLRKSENCSTPRSHLTSSTFAYVHAYPRGSTTHQHHETPMSSDLVNDQHARIVPNSGSDEMRRRVPSRKRNSDLNLETDCIERKSNRTSEANLVPFFQFSQRPSFGNSAEYCAAPLLKCPQQRSQPPRAPFSNVCSGTSENIGTQFNMDKVTDVDCQIRSEHFSRTMPSWPSPYLPQLSEQRPLYSSRSSASPSSSPSPDASSTPSSPQVYSYTPISPALSTSAKSESPEVVDRYSSVQIPSFHTVTRDRNSRSSFAESLKNNVPMSNISSQCKTSQPVVSGLVEKSSDSLSWQQQYLKHLVQQEQCKVFPGNNPQIENSIQQRSKLSRLYSEHPEHWVSSKQLRLEQSVSEQPQTQKKEKHNAKTKIRRKKLSRGRRKQQSELKEEGNHHITDKQNFAEKERSNMQNRLSYKESDVSIAEETLWQRMYTRLEDLPFERFQFSGIQQDPDDWNKRDQVHNVMARTQRSDENQPKTSIEHCNPHNRQKESLHQQFLNPLYVKCHEGHDPNHGRNTQILHQQLSYRTHQNKQVFQRENHEDSMYLPNTFYAQQYHQPDYSHGAIYQNNFNCQTQRQTFGDHQDIERDLSSLQNPQTLPIPRWRRSWAVKGNATPQTSQHNNTAPLRDQNEHVSPSYGTVVQNVSRAGPFNGDRQTVFEATPSSRFPSGQFYGPSASCLPLHHQHAPTTFVADNGTCRFPLTKQSNSPFQTNSSFSACYPLPVQKQTQTARTIRYESLSSDENFPLTTTPPDEQSSISKSVLLSHDFNNQTMYTQARQPCQQQPGQVFPAPVHSQAVLHGPATEPGKTIEFGTVTERGQAPIQRQAFSHGQIPVHGQAVAYEQGRVHSQTGVHGQTVSHVYQLPGTTISSVGQISTSKKTKTRFNVDNGSVPMVPGGDSYLSIYKAYPQLDKNASSISSFNFQTSGYLEDVSSQANEHNISCPDDATLNYSKSQTGPKLYLISPEKETQIPKTVPNSSSNTVNTSKHQTAVEHQQPNIFLYKMPNAISGSVFQQKHSSGILGQQACLQNDVSNEMTQERNPSNFQRSSNCFGMQSGQRFQPNNVNCPVGDQRSVEIMNSVQQNPARTSFDIHPGPPHQLSLDSTNLPSRLGTYNLVVNAPSEASINGNSLNSQDCTVSFSVESGGQGRTTGVPADDDNNVIMLDSQNTALTDTTEQSVPRVAQHCPAHKRNSWHSPKTGATDRVIVTDRGTTIDLTSADNDIPTSHQIASKLLSNAKPIYSKANLFTTTMNSSGIRISSVFSLATSRQTKRRAMSDSVLHGVGTIDIQGDVAQDNATVVTEMAYGKDEGVVFRADSHGPCTLSTASTPGLLVQCQEAHQNLMCTSDCVINTGGASSKSQSSTELSNSMLTCVSVEPQTCPKPEMDLALQKAFSSAMDLPSMPRTPAQTLSEVDVFVPQQGTPVTESFSTTLEPMTQCPFPGPMNQPCNKNDINYQSAPLQIAQPQHDTTEGNFSNEDFKHHPMPSNPRGMKCLHESGSKCMEREVLDMPVLKFSEQHMVTSTPNCLYPPNEASVSRCNSGVEHNARRKAVAKPNQRKDTSNSLRTDKLKNKKPINISSKRRIGEIKRQTSTPRRRSERISSRGPTDSATTSSSNDQSKSQLKDIRSRVKENWERRCIQNNTKISQPSKRFNKCKPVDFNRRSVQVICEPIDSRKSMVIKLQRLERSVSMTKKKKNDGKKRFGAGASQRIGPGNRQRCQENSMKKTVQGISNDKPDKNKTHLRLQHTKPSSRNRSQTGKSPEDRRKHGKIAGQSDVVGDLDTDTFFPTLSDNSSSESIQSADVCLETEKIDRQSSNQFLESQITEKSRCAEGISGKKCQPSVFPSSSLSVAVHNHPSVFHEHQLRCVELEGQHHVVLEELLDKCFPGLPRAQVERARLRDLHLPTRSVHLLDSGKSGDTADSTRVLALSDAARLVHFFLGKKRCFITKKALASSLKKTKETISNESHEGIKSSRKSSVTVNGKNSVKSESSVQDNIAKDVDDGDSICTKGIVICSLAPEVQSKDSDGQEDSQSCSSDQTLAYSDGQPLLTSRGKANPKTDISIRSSCDCGSETPTPYQNVNKTFQTHSLSLQGSLHPSRFTDNSGKGCVLRSSEGSPIAVASPLLPPLLSYMATPFTASVKTGNDRGLLQCSSTSPSLGQGSLIGAPMLLSPDNAEKSLFQEDIFAGFSHRKSVSAEMVDVHSSRQPSENCTSTRQNFAPSEVDNAGTQLTQIGVCDLTKTEYQSCQDCLTDVDADEIDDVFVNDTPCSKDNEVGTEATNERLIKADVSKTSITKTTSMGFCPSEVFEHNGTAKSASVQVYNKDVLPGQKSKICCSEKSHMQAVAEGTEKREFEKHNHQECTYGVDDTEVKMEYADIVDQDQGHDGEIYCPENDLTILCKKEEPNDAENDTKTGISEKFIPRDCTCIDSFISESENSLDEKGLINKKAFSLDQRHSSEAVIVYEAKNEEKEMYFDNGSSNQFNLHPRSAVEVNKIQPQGAARDVELCAQGHMKDAEHCPQGPVRDAVFYPRSSVEDADLNSQCSVEGAGFNSRGSVQNSGLNSRGSVRGTGLNSRGFVEAVELHSTEPMRATEFTAVNTGMKGICLPITSQSAESCVTKNNCTKENFDYDSVNHSFQDERQLPQGPGESLKDRVHYFIAHSSGFTPRMAIKSNSLPDLCISETHAGLDKNLKQSGVSIPRAFKYRRTSQPEFSVTCDDPNWIKVGDTSPSSISGLSTNFAAGEKEVRVFETVEDIASKSFHSSDSITSSNKTTSGNIMNENISIEPTDTVGVSDISGQSHTLKVRSRTSRHHSDSVLSEHASCTEHGSPMCPCEDSGVESVHEVATGPEGVPWHTPGTPISTWPSYDSYSKPIPSPFPIAITCMTPARPESAGIVVESPRFFPCSQQDSVSDDVKGRSTGITYREQEHKQKGSISEQNGDALACMYEDMVNTERSVNEDRSCSSCNADNFSDNANNISEAALNSEIAVSEDQENVADKLNFEIVLNGGQENLEAELNSELALINGGLEKLEADRNSEIASQCVLNLEGDGYIITVNMEEEIDSENRSSEENLQYTIEVAETSSDSSFGACTQGGSADGTAVLSETSNSQRLNIASKEGLSDMGPNVNNSCKSLPDNTNLSNEHPTASSALHDTGSDQPDSLMTPSTAVVILDANGVNIRTVSECNSSSWTGASETQYTHIDAEEVNTELVLHDMKCDKVFPATTITIDTSHETTSTDRTATQKLQREAQYRSSSSQTFIQRTSLESGNISDSTAERVQSADSLSTSENAPWAAKRKITIAEYKERQRLKQH